MPERYSRGALGMRLSLLGRHAPAIGYENPVSRGSASGVAAAVVGPGVYAASGMISTWPTLKAVASGRWLASTIASTVTPYRCAMSYRVSPSCTVYVTSASGNVGVGVGVPDGAAVLAGVSDCASLDSPELQAPYKTRAATMMTAAASAGTPGLLLDRIPFLLHNAFDLTHRDGARIVVQRHLFDGRVAGNERHAGQLRDCLLDALDAVVAGDVRGFECYLGHLGPPSYPMIARRVAMRTASACAFSSILSSSSTSPKPFSWR